MSLKSNRKTFLQQLAAGTALAALGWSERLLSQTGALKSGDPGASPVANPNEDEWDAVRKQFHLPEQTYLNTGTLGLMSIPVLEHVTKRMALIGSGIYSVDEEVRSIVAMMLNAGTDEISLTHNTTEGINVVAAGLRLRRGEEIILTDQEHVGNALPWLYRAKRDGLRIRVLQPADTAAETLNRLESLINRRTRVFALPHVTCTSGHVLPAKEIATIARNKGIYSFFDGAHGPGMLFPDVKDIGCDFYAACGHKWLCGPAGTGMLYLRKELLDTVQASMIGAYSDTGWTLNQEKQLLGPLVPTAHRYDYATQNAALLEGMMVAILFMKGLGFENVRNRIAYLGGYLQSRLMERNYLQMLTPTEAISRSGMIGFKLQGKATKDIERTELTRRFRLRLVPESGLESVRVSAHIYSSPAELDAFVTELDRFMVI